VRETRGRAGPRARARLPIPPDLLAPRAPPAARRPAPRAAAAALSAVYRCWRLPGYAPTPVLVVHGARCCRRRPMAPALVFQLSCIGGAAASWRGLGGRHPGAQVCVPQCPCACICARALCVPSLPRSDPRAALLASVRRRSGRRPARGLKWGRGWACPCPIAPTCMHACMWRGTPGGGGGLRRRRVAGVTIGRRMQAVVDSPVSLCACWVAWASARAGARAGR
jgi:hypothetical protein